MSPRGPRERGDAKDVLEVAVPVATVWTSPVAPRGVDKAAVADLPDPAAWTAELDAEGTMDRRLGLHGRTLTQLLLGEPVRLLEERGEWARVAGLWQRSSAHDEGYPGWVRRAHLGARVDRADGPVCVVTAPGARCRTDAGTWALSCGTWLRVDPAAEAAGLDAERGSESIVVLLPGGRRGSVPRADVRVVDERGGESSLSPEDLLATARLFLGVRYLWGGTCRWGLDCSGLVHLVLRVHGRSFPRDAFDQAAAPDLEPVPVDDVRAGDLYFFARPGEQVSHVGFATRPVETDGTRWMLHAPEGGGLVEDAPMAPQRAATLVSAGRVGPTGATP